MPNNPTLRFLLAGSVLGITLSVSWAQPATAEKPTQPAKEVAKQPAKGPAKDATANPATSPVDRKDEWWAQRQAAFNERVKQGAEKGDIGILFIGDSITQGWEGNGKEVWAKQFAPRHAVNLGIGGDRTQHVLWRLDNGNVEGLARPASGEAPKLAILMIGTNNVGDTPPEQTAAGVTAIVTKLRQKLPQTKVLVLAIFPREEKPGALRAKNAKVNEQIAKLADGSMIFYHDIGPAFLEPDGTLTKEIMPDALHLSPKGYQLWADAIEEDVKKLLGEK